jgi:1-acyl-sn-glycerol-3-phosphate acyltransferase
MKRFTRAFLSGFCFFVFGIGGLVAGTLIAPFPLLLCNKRTQRRILSNTVHYLWKAFVWLMCVLKLISVKIPNENKLKRLDGKIIIANHPSLIDVVILVSKIPHSICVVKGSLFQNFFVKFLIRHIYLSNSMRPSEFLVAATNYLNDGYNIIIFPEGTRTIKGKPVHLHRGFAYLHLHSKHDIQPIHIKNIPHILGKTDKWYNVGNKTSVYTLKILPPLHFQTDNALTIRQSAISITEKAKKSLFSAHNA